MQKNSTEHQTYHGKEGGHFLKDEFSKHDENGGDSAVLRKGRRVILLLGRHDAQSWEYKGKSRGSWAAGKGRTGIKGWFLGLDHRPGTSELPCTLAIGFWICSKQPAEGLKKVTHEKCFPPASGYYITVVAVNGTGNKHKQLAWAVLLAEHVTANYFRQRNWCGLIRGGTFWLWSNSSKIATVGTENHKYVHNHALYMIKQLLTVNIVCWGPIVLLLDE